ncbi:MAG: hypothetical protein ACREIL_00455 [Nitrospiraceae bacterium]
MSERDYPTNEELKVIEAWPANTTDSIRALLALVKERWNWPDWGWHQDGSRLLISTGGWYGNEDLIDALRGNFMFWVLCWVSVRRGGHFEFNVPELAEEAIKPIEEPK